SGIENAGCNECPVSINLLSVKFWYGKIIEVFAEKQLILSIVIAAYEPESTSAVIPAPEPE
ncbi:MAG: hypothetical protein ACC663_08020, partial [Gammaproteobacteria bacterium]